jgi:hypothetical protein
MVLQSTGTSTLWVSTSSFASLLNSFVQNGNSFGGTATLGTNDANALSFETNNATRMIITSAGNVGIGTTTPSATLSLVGSGTLNLFSFASSTGSTLLALDRRGALNFGVAGTDANIYINGGPTSTPVGNSISNVAIGNEAFSFISAGGDGATDNIAMGYQALFGSSSALMTGDGNTAFGYQSLYTNTTGSHNNALGVTTLVHNTTGSSNNALGYQALLSNVSGSYNNALGYQALGTNESGTDNNAFGRQTLLNNTIGSHNIGIGYLALRDNTIGGNNTAFGNNALRDNISGNDNIALGQEALFHGTTTSENIAIGIQSMGWATVVGSGNVGLGAYSLGSLTSGAYNTAIGYNALQNNYAGAYNTALGYQAGNANTTGTSTLFLGDGADAITGALINAAAIGSHAKVGRSNAMVLGGTGSWATDIVTGTSTPFAKFSIQGTYGSTTALFDIASTTSAGYATSSLFKVLANGNIGIGSSTPIASFSLMGRGGATPLLIASSSGVSMLTLDQAGRLLVGTSTSNATFGNLIYGTTTLIATSSSSPTALRAIGNIDNTMSSTIYPKVASTTSTAANPYSVFVSGRYAYVANSGSSSMSIIDISNPASPVTVATSSAGTNPNSVFVSGRYAYVANNGSASMSIIDISNPASPVTVATPSVGSNPFSVFVSGRYAYVANQGAASMSIIDISNPASPVTVSTPSVGSSPRSVFVSGRYAYVVNSGGSSMSIIDISNPASPLTISTPSTGSFPYSVFVSGRYAYVTSLLGSSLSVIDISNPASPVTVSTPSAGSLPYSVFVSGRYAYVANSGGNSVSIIDISNPASPVTVSTLRVGSSPYSVFVSGHYAYVINGNDNSLSILDIGGLESTSATIHSLEAGNLSVRNSVDINGMLNVNTGLTVGIGGFASQGNSSIFGSLSVGTSSYPLLFANAAISTVGVGTSTGLSSFTIQGTTTKDLFTVASSTGSTLFTILANGNVGIGSSTPSRTLSIRGDLSLTGGFFDSSNASGTEGMVLQTTGTTTRWVATSSLGISGGSGVSGGINGFLARFTGASTLSTGLLVDNGTVAGVNATSSSYTFNLQGSAGVNPFNVASSSGTSLLSVLASGRVGIGTTTPGAGLTVADEEMQVGLGRIIFSRAYPNLVMMGINNATNTGAAGNSVLVGIGNTVRYLNSVAMGRDNNTDEADSGLALGIGNLVSIDSGIAIGRSNTISGAGAMAFGANITNSVDNSLQIGPSNTAKIAILSSGNVGIGTTSPSSLLYIQGAASAPTATLFTVASSTGVSLLALQSSGILTFGTSTFSNILINGGSTTTNAQTNGRNVAIGGDSLSFYAASALDNVALGYQALYGSSSVLMSGTNNFAAGYQALLRNTTGSSNIALGNSSLSKNYTGYSNIAIGDRAAWDITSGISNIYIGALATANLNTYSSSTAIGAGATIGCSNCFILGGTGVNAVNVGIGTSLPTDFFGTRRSLVIQDTTNDVALRLLGSGSTDLELTSITGFGSLGTRNASALNLFTNNTPRLLIDSSGNVGIGTSTPTAALDVYKGVSSTSTDIFRVISDVTSSGNVVFKVKANGDVFTDGATTIGTPADLAEKYPTHESLSAGTVVAFASTTEEWSLDNGETVGNTYQMSTIRKAEAGDEALGVISTRPGILLGGNTLNGAAVAFSGRVPVLVTSENGAVKRGDYLTISTSSPGYAMKATDNAYTIGRAISDADSSATTSVLMVVENKHHTVTIASIEGLTILASSSDSFSKPSRSVYETVVEKIVHGNTVVVEYFSLTTKAVAGYFDKLFAKEIYTEKVCVKKSDGTDVCLNGDQVEEMLNASQIPLLTAPSGNGGGSVQGGGSTGGDGSGVSSSTDPTSDTGTTTPPVATTTEQAPPQDETTASPSSGGVGGETPPVLDPGVPSSTPSQETPVTETPATETP